MTDQPENTDEIVVLTLQRELARYKARVKQLTTALHRIENVTNNDELGRKIHDIIQAGLKP